MNPQTDFDSGILYARLSFLTGFISIFDWAGILNVYNESPTPELADMNAAKSDWNAVGNDIRSAMRKLDEEITRKQISISTTTHLR
jgi:hypothetical protein